MWSFICGSLSLPLVFGQVAGVDCAEIDKHKQDALEFCDAKNTKALRLFSYLCQGSDLSVIV